MLYKLEIVCGNSKVNDLVLDHDIVTIGRKSDNNIQLNDTTVSSHHAKIINSPQNVYLLDLDSTNGTYVNGKVVREHILSEGDVIMVGVHKLFFEANATQESEELHDPTLKLSRKAIDQLLSVATEYIPDAASDTAEKPIKWIAQDEEGVWWGFDHEPDPEIKGWHSFGDTMRLKLKRGSPNPNWRKTLNKV